AAGQHLVHAIGAGGGHPRGDGHTFSHARTVTGRRRAVKPPEDRGAGRGGCEEPFFTRHAPPATRHDPQYRHSRPKLTPRTQKSVVLKGTTGCTGPAGANGLNGGIRFVFSTRSIWSPGRTTLLIYRKL